MVGPRAPLGKLTDHLKGMLGGRPETTVSRPSLSDLKNGNNGASFDDSSDESSDSDSSSSDSDSDDGGKKSSFLDKISGTTKASPAKTNGVAASKSTPVPKPTVPSVPAKKEAVVKRESSTSSEASSESESSEEEESSSEANSSESESEEEEKVAPKKADKGASNKAAAAADTSTSSSAVTSSSSSRSASVESGESKEEEEDEEESESESESKSEKLVADDEASDQEMADQSFAIATRENGDSQVANSAPHFATQGFELRRADESNDASDVARVFRQAKLEGKQLWYFTAPSSVPITVVEKLAIPVAQAEQGKAILNHEHEDYGMSFDDALTSKTIKLLIPNKTGDKYSILDRTIDKTMHLKRVTRFSRDGADAADVDAALAVQAPAATKKPAKKQPEGLRARYLPIGVNDTVNSSKKRKHGDASTAAAPAASADSDDESDGGAAIKASKKKIKATEPAAAEPSPKKARKEKSADKEEDKASKKDKKPASAVPLPPIPGLTAAPAHKVTPVAPPVLPASALKTSSAASTEKVAKKKSSDNGNVLPSSSQLSFSQIDTPSKIVVDDKVVTKKSKDKKKLAAVEEADADAMDIDGDDDAAPAETNSDKKKKEKKEKKEKKDKSEKSEKKEKKEKKDKKEKKEKKERKAAKDEDDSVATPVAGLSTSAAQPKKVTPVPLPRMN